MIPMLEPIFQGEWAPYGETLQCAPQWPASALRLADWLRSPEAMADTLTRYARRWGAGQRDPRAVASAWTLDYLWTLLPPVVAAATVLQHRFPTAASDIALLLDDQGKPLSFHITAEGATLPGSSTAERYHALLHGHLQPLFSALHHHTRVAEKILWSNAARYLGDILEEAEEHLPGPPPLLQQDREHLLERGGWPLTQCNPMQALPRRTAQGGHGREMPLHSHCCLYYLLPEQPYCGACPLAPQHRATLRTTVPSA
ncbi:ferric iron reductase protein FhuF [Roseateles sp. YR242]|uniref:siderophore-iron reductase FhuF n=1 Tax=Roseateles sp. YR242 TaxID=1855305 RepID=UPI0008D03F3F|nr:siderophore-iron reductase FhuF [Roseateles sp. YR242]SEL61639.1 ferric iron reductase protein FhuF [Roseateles sp. YR242]